MVEKQFLLRKKQKAIPFRIASWYLYSMKIKEQTRKLASGCSKHCFEVVDRTDEVSNHTYGKATLTWFEFDFRRVLDLFSDDLFS